MPKVLTTQSNISCGHGGKVDVESSAKLSVDGSPVLLKNSIDGKDVIDCKTQEALDASGTTIAKPCNKVSSVPPGPGVTAGEATKLKVRGKPVMLDTLTGKTDGMVGKVTPQPLLNATAGQSKLTTI